MQILVGCDPEYFVKKNGQFLSAFGLIQGDKKNPLRVDKGAVQVDGMALEFNIDAAATEQEFVVNIDTVLQQLRAMVPDYEHAFVPVANFDPAYMAQQPKEALELGCDPDYNAWANCVNHKPDGNRPFRTASGHVHIGWTNGAESTDGNHIAVCNDVVKQMDFFLGLPSLFYDADTKRREMYGKAGCCRYKSYGVEYRTLSNAWLLTEERKRWVYRQIQKGCELMMNGVLLHEQYGDIQEIINTSDLKKANGIINQAGIEMVA